MPNPLRAATPQNYFHDLSYIIETDVFTLNVLFNNHFVKLVISADNLKDSPELLQKLRRGLEFDKLERNYCEHGHDLYYDSESDTEPDLVSSDSHCITDYESEHFYNDFITWVRFASETYLTSTLPPRTPSSTPTLDEFIFPDITICTFHAVDDQLVPLSIVCEPSPESLSQSIWSRHFPIVPPSQLLVDLDPDDGLSFADPEFTPSFVARASDPETKLLFKSTPLGAEAELATYTAIRLANLDTASGMRVPKLVGVVQAETGGRVLGLLLEDVAAYATLNDLHLPTTKHSWLSRWVQQINETITTLHSAGISWGNVDLEDVSIDKNQNAWLFNLGDDMKNDGMSGSHTNSIDTDRNALWNLARAITDTTTI